MHRFWKENKSCGDVPSRGHNAIRCEIDLFRYCDANSDKIVNIGPQVSLSFDLIFANKEAEIVKRTKERNGAEWNEAQVQKEIGQTLLTIGNRHRNDRKCKGENRISVKCPWPRLGYYNLPIYTICMHGLRLNLVHGNPNNWTWQTNISKLKP